MSMASCGGNERDGTVRTCADVGGVPDRTAPGRRSRAHAPRGSTGTAMAAVVVLAVGLAACGGSGNATRLSTSATGTRTSSVPSTSALASTTTAPPGSTTVVHLSVEPCATSFGIPTSTTAPLPLTVQATVPANVTGQVSTFAAFSDTQGVMLVIAPRTWTCRAQIDADGSGWVMVAPTGTTFPTSGQQLPAQGIVASQTSACVDCTLSQACPLFPAALTALHAYDPKLPCATLSPQVKVTRTSATEVWFAVPAGVTGLPSGTGATSGGGPYPVQGVMTWSSARARGAWTSTCTLPASASSVCKASLTAFAAAYPAS